MQFSHLSHFHNFRRRFSLNGTEKQSEMLTICKSTPKALKIATSSKSLKEFFGACDLRSFNRFKLHPVDSRTRNSAIIHENCELKENTYEKLKINTPHKVNNDCEKLRKQSHRKLRSSASGVLYSVPLNKALNREEQQLSMTFAPRTLKL